MRYCGSKKRFIKYLKPILEKHIKEDTLFVDAFCGGANVISEIDCNHKIGVELNEYICALWKHLQTRGMDGIPQSLTREEYEDIKDNYLRKTNKYPKWLTGYVGACCSYGGGWFNGYAKFNPNRNEDHIKEAYENLKKHIENFKCLDTTYFANTSYDSLYFPPGSVIYCDPPYANSKKYESDFDHIKFWEWVRVMSSGGRYVYVSEYEAPSDFKCIWSKKKKDGMGTTLIGNRQNAKIEKLFVYKNAKK